MPIESGETLICDTSFVSHSSRRLQAPARYAHWDASIVKRVAAARLAISIVTIGEVRFGQLLMGWGFRRIVQSERRLATYLPPTIDDPHLNEWARLAAAARSRGIAIGDNDLWIAATASVKESVLVTCDRDHLRIAGDLPVEVVYLQPPAVRPPV
jgi:predicted nucleic acid-binding protein